MKPSIPKGTRDFSPQEMVKRNYIFDIIRKVYQSYGYQPIETPAMENSETLMGKYGDEGDRLIFKILNSGDYLDGLSDLPPVTLPSSPDPSSHTSYSLPSSPSPSSLTSYSLPSLPQLTKHISEKALRYDLTVPFARYVVQHRNDITFPFKRYQIQPVWRADRPQKGRYREFYQCDADVIGSDSLLNEVELIQIIDEVFTKLGMPVIIKINNRKILQGFADVINAPEKMIDIATAIDKFDKIGPAGVKKELQEKGFTEKQIEKLTGLIYASPEVGVFKNEFDNFNTVNEKPLLQIKNSGLADESYIIGKGVKEIEYILDNFKARYNNFYEEYSDSNSRIELDFSLARGLNYYTGTIIEVKVDASKCASQFTSSICGGGRYDDLTGIFGLPDVSGVGVSFGADRIYDVMEELNLFPNDIVASTKVLLINFGDKEAQYGLKVLKDLHTAGISAELYPDAKKINKQFEYADKRNIPYVVLIGQDEINKGVIKFRNRISKEEKEMAVTQLIEYLKDI